MLNRFGPLLFLFVAAHVADGATRPNILFLFSDDQRADTLSALGNAEVRTPTLDRLVRGGTSFSRAYCMGANNGAVCIPSRAMLMSGRSLFRVSETLERHETWPEKFRAAGYRTFMTGKWHNGVPSLLRSFAGGKAIFPDGMGDPYRLPLHQIEAGRFVAMPATGRHATEVFADAAVEFLEGMRGQAAPFLCFVSFTLPHDPRVAPPAYHRAMESRALRHPENFLPQHPFNNGALTIRDEALAAWPRTREEVRSHLAEYYACIEYVDAQIARILAALDASGKAHETVVVFSSDHGLAIGSHGLFGKQNLYEHSMRAPLVFSGSGVPRGKTSDAMCYLFDIFPTLGALAGVDAPAGNEGRSLVPVLRGETTTHREAIFTAYTTAQRAVRDERWKMITYPRINRTQLFDLAADPAETRDLAERAEHRGELLRLTRLLRDAQSAAGDQQPLTSDHPSAAEFDFSKVKRPHAARGGE